MSSKNITLIGNYCFTYLKRKTVMESILVVEDNDSVREEIIDILEMENFRVYEAANGREAFTIAYDYIPELIISDIVMPEISGYQLFGNLRSNDRTRKIPFIFLSAKAAVSDIRKGMNMGAFDYLTKPLNAFDLISAVRRNIQKVSTIEAEIEDLKLNLSDVLPHELKTPLNGLYGLSGFLAGNIENISTNQTKEIALAINESAERLSKLIDNYLLYSQLLMMKLKPNIANCLLKVDKIDVGKIFSGQINDNNVVTRPNDFEYNIESAFVKCNVLLFEKIINELLKNAFKFSNPGQKVVVSSLKTKEKYVFKVYNEGVGMKSAYLEKITAFKQFDKTLLAQQGAGLGLAIIKLIGDLFDLDIRIKSTYKKNFFISVSFERFNPIK